jgi:putative peptide zinc metalloprotease protein
VLEIVGSWVTRGTAIGLIVDDRAFRFVAVVTQEEAAGLFGERVRGAEVRVSGHAATDAAVRSWRIIPFQQKQLPSAALGWRAGGTLAVSLKDASGTESAEPFFEIHADLAPTPGVAMLQGRTGLLRLTLIPEPLAVQWVRSLRQLVQRRYRT